MSEVRKRKSDSKLSSPTVNGAVQAKIEGRTSENESFFVPKTVNTAQALAYPRNWSLSTYAESSHVSQVDCFYFLLRWF